MKSTFLPACLLVILAQVAQAQSKPAPSITFSGYAEAYYAYDFSTPENHERPSFLYSHNRHNEFNLNLGYLKAAHAGERTRGNLALMTGTYAQANLASEPATLRHVLEANVGIKLSKSKNWWLDMGVMPSHIGFESAIGKDCRTLSRSMAAENSPYYESGLKIGYTSDADKVYFAMMLLNGWQRIARPRGNNTLAFGTQLTLKPNDKTTLNFSSFIGNDKPDASSQLRIFNNLYGIFQVSQRSNLSLGFDIGMEKKGPNEDGYHTWYTPVAILSVGLREQLTLGLRAEYYSDPNNVIVSVENEEGFSTFGLSANLDWQPSEQAMLRLEIRNLSSSDKLYVRGNKPVSSNQCVALASMFWF